MRGGGTHLSSLFDRFDEGGPSVGARQIREDRRPKEAARVAGEFPSLPFPSVPFLSLRSATGNCHNAGMENYRGLGEW